MAMNDTEHWVVSYLMNSLWQIPLFLLVGGMISKIVARLGSSAQHALWIAILLVSVLTPACNNLVLHSNRQMIGTGILLFDRASTVDQNLSPWNGQLHLGPTLYSAFFIGYIVLSAYWFARMGLALTKTWLLRRRAKEIALPEDVESIWRVCCNAFSVGYGAVRGSEAIAGPTIVGWRKPTLIVPPDFFKGCREEDLIAALSHECAHMQRQDFLINLLYEALALPIAFHPCTWILKARIAETRESICDAMAAENMGSSSHYAQSLLRLATAIYARPVTGKLHGIGMFDADVLERRVITLMKEKKLFSWKKKLAFVLPGIVLLGSISVAALALAINVDQQPSEETSPEKVYHIGNGVSAPNLIHAVDPKFPPEFSQNKEQFSGHCVVALVVDADGMPQNIHVTRSLGSSFDEMAMMAIKEYRFKPATYKGKPVPVQIHVEVNFRRY